MLSRWCRKCAEEDPMSDGNMRERLRQLYFTQLRERLETLQRALSALRSHDGELDYQALEFEAHRLRGTGTTYGFPDITATAEALEERLRSGPADRKTVAALLTPLIAAMNRALDNAGKALAPMPPAPPQRAGYRPSILVADDDPAVMNNLAPQLSFAQIQGVATGSAALEATALRRYDLAIVDCHLPDMNGLAVLARLAQTAVPVMMLTAAGDRAERFLEAGACDCVVKPVAPGPFAERVRHTLAQQKKTVLVADDDPLVREIFRKKLSERGMSVMLAANGAEALSMARQFHPQAIVLDRAMPRLDGLQVLREIRKEDDTRSTPVVILSARNSRDDISAGYREGADVYLVKPFIPEQVVACCMSLLEPPRQIGPRSLSNWIYL
jgi:DNA-binding response OmpR family regulator